MLIVVVVSEMENLLKIKNEFALMNLISESPM